MKKTLIRIIAMLEIIGGLAGLGFVAWALTHQALNIISLLFGLIVTSIDILSLVAGIALWRDSPFGRRASLLVQLIQIPKIVSPAVIFVFSFGFDLWIHFVTNNEISTVGFQTAVLSSNQLFLNVPDAPLGVGVSVTGLIFLTVLTRYEPKQPQETLPPPPPGDIATSLDPSIPPPASNPD